LPCKFGRCGVERLSPAFFEPADIVASHWATIASRCVGTVRSCRPSVEAGERIATKGVGSPDSSPTLASRTPLLNPRARYACCRTFRSCGGGHCWRARSAANGMRWSWQIPCSAHTNVPGEKRRSTATTPPGPRNGISPEPPFPTLERCRFFLPLFCLSGGPCNTFFPPHN
jgi:hypothetical protein